LSHVNRRRTDVLVLGLWGAGLGVVRSLARAGLSVVGLDCDPRAPGFLSRRCVARPCPAPLDEPELLVAALRTEARRGDRPVVLCATDEFAWFLAAHRGELAPELRFTVPPPELTPFLLDKYVQYEAATRVGVACPQTWAPANPEEVRAIAPSAKYPVFVKARESHSWRRRMGLETKGFEARTPDELVARFDEVHAAGVPALVQSVIAGPATAQVEVSAYLGRGGEVLATFAARKLRLHPPDFGNATLLESSEEPAAVEVALRLLRGVGYRGFASVELKEDATDGMLRLIEVNPEPQTALPIDCGVDFPLLEYLDALGSPLPPRRPYTPGVRWWSGAEDLKSFLAQRRRGSLTTAAWVTSWLRARSFSTFAADDPLPLVGWYASRAVAAVRRRLAGRHATRA
jgi:D-aspartate ligase